MSKIISTEEFIEKINKKTFQTQDVVWTRYQTKKWLKEYAELVRAATLEEVVANTNHTKAFIKKDKQSILDLVTHSNLEIK